MERDKDPHTCLAPPHSREQYFSIDIVVPPQRYTNSQLVLEATLRNLQHLLHFKDFEASRECSA